jgi:tetratricopeptide (TPR) repeat protein
MDGIFGGLPGCVECLAHSLARGADPRTAELDFAREVHYGDRHEIALQVIERVLEDDATHIPALELKADVLEHRERYSEAETLARVVLEREPTSRSAWQTLAYVFEDQERWGELLRAAERCLELEGDALHSAMHKRARARALLGLGETVRAHEEIDALERRGGNAAIQARRLRLLLSGTRPRHDCGSSWRPLT